MRKINSFKIIISLFALAISFFAANKVVYAVDPVAGFRLNLVVNQAKDHSLSFSSINLEAGTYVSYGINFQSEYFLIRIVDSINTDLFSGKITHTYRTSAPDNFNAPNYTGETIIPDVLNLLLPYFNQARWVRLFDDKEILKLEVDLGSHNLVGVKYRYAYCDACGYCKSGTAPQSWEKCRACLYPSARPPATTNDTLRIEDPSAIVGPTTYPGHAYTIVGCIESPLGTFQNAGAASSVSQKFLNIIFALAGGLSLLFFLYGAFVILTAQGRSDRFLYGKRLVKGAVIGLLFVLGSVFIVRLLVNDILKIP